MCKQEFVFSQACYVNSLLQTYFMIPSFVKEVLAFEEPDLEELKGPISKEKDLTKFRQKCSIGLTKNLQRLFALMIKSNKKYVDPSQVLQLLVDDQGNSIAVGDQKDISEYNMNFLARVIEGIQLQSRYAIEQSFTRKQAFKSGKEEMVKTSESLMKAAHPPQNSTRSTRSMQKISGLQCARVCSLASKRRL
eukprot:TRINITY_DN12056_c0_g1_i2.p1 TRINITY_DN12056_c0_g1~~TRINITY_DN12056_c0_g1_i2.p1  ORF type:complete len:192 (+),score=47.19 TRINITY_DN12056_c0_g1_i2:306-881(+)